MPETVYVNPWPGNPWDPELDRETAASLESLGLGFEFRPIALAGPDDAGARYASLVLDWPDAGPVIDAALHVDSGLRTAVLAYRNAKTSDEEKKRKPLQCFDYADYQLDRANHGTTERPSRDPKNFQLLLERVTPGGPVDEIDVAAAAGAVEYLKSALAEGVPVLVGVRLNTYDPRPNDLASTPDVVEPTNHFVVVVGMGSDGDRRYFSYYDYLHRPAVRDRLYLDADMGLRTDGGTRDLVQVRRSWRKRP